MTTAFIVPGIPSADAANELARRLVACGCDTALSDHTSPISIEDMSGAIQASDVVVVIITQPLEPLAVRAIELGMELGKRICGVWPAGAAQQNAPAQLEDHADAVLTWNSANFCKAVCDGEAMWEGGDGELRPAPQRPHHRC